MGFILRVRVVDSTLVDITTCEIVIHHFNGKGPGRDSCQCIKDDSGKLSQFPIERLDSAESVSWGSNCIYIRCCSVLYRYKKK